MCGIAGYYNSNGAPIQTNTEIVNMLEVQRHRGPDDSGVVLFSLNESTNHEITHKETVKIHEPFEGVLGFNRLSILDLSYHGHQPMMNADGNVILTLNGEVYNAFDFCDELKNDGYHFNGTSDTEVVLNLYLKYGFDKMLDLLNGMFAIAIVDLRIGEVLIARDRFGIKPMYYFCQNGQIGFSSELKSFYELKGFKATLNKDLLDEFLLFRNVRDECLINEVEILPPGYSLRFGKDGAIKLSRFFDINDYQRQKVISDDRETLINDVHDTLKKSVKSQLISDVKLGCQLSGGIDSSLVTFLANDIVENKNFESVSIILDNPNYSEEKYIDKVTEVVKIKAHKFKMDSNYYLNHLKSVTRHLEVPINHPNSVGIYLLSQRAKDYVTVLLSGEGADEVFGGYSRFSFMKYRYRMPFLKGLVKSFPKNLFKYLKNYRDISYQAIINTAYMPLEAAKKIKPDFNLKHALKPRLELYEELTGSVFDKQVKYEMKTYIPDLLIRQDKMSMAHSIENRVPFLDNEVVKRAFNYPEEMLVKAKKNQEKFLLKELSSRFFGKDFSYRHKMGFGIPLRDFFKDEEFKLYLTEELLPSMLKRGLFDNAELKYLFNKIDELSYKDMQTFWILMSLEIWLQEFIDVSSSN